MKFKITNSYLPLLVGSMIVIKKYNYTTLQLSLKKKFI